MVLITGTQGSIGSFVFAHLRKKKRPLIVVDLMKPKELSRSIPYYRLDLTSPGADGRLATILKKEKVEAVLHMATLWTPTRNREEAHEVEVIGTIHLLNACHQAGVRKFIYVSSTVAYGAKSTNPNYIDETYPLYGGYSNQYVRDKVEVEEEIRKYRKSHPGDVITVLRPCMVLGPKIENYVSRVLSQPLIPTLLGYDPLVQFLHERDLVRAIELVLKKDYSGEFNIVGEGVLPLSHVVKRTGQTPVPMLYSLAKPLLSMLWTAQLTEFSPEMLDFLRYLWIADGAKAKEELGFVPKFSSEQTLESFL